MIQELRQKMPFQSQSEVYHDYAKTVDLRSDLEKDFPRAVKQTKPIAERFRGSSMKESARNIHKFLRENIVFLADHPERQVLKAPSALIHDLFADCKSFSQWFCACMYNLGYDVFYKYASYRCPSCGDRCKCGMGSPNFPTPSHVYGIAGNESDYLTLDGTNPGFNEERKPGFFLLKKLPDMRVTSLSDESLSPEAAKDFYATIGRMSSGQRVQFLNQFSANNREKILVALRSVGKINELDELRQGVSNVSAILFSNPPQMWETWSTAIYKYNSPYARNSWSGGVNWNYLNAAGIDGNLSSERLAGRAYVNADSSDRLADEHLAGKFGRRFLSIFNKINPVIAIGRGAFMALVAIDKIGWGIKLQKILDAGKGDRIKEIWYKLGGKWDRLEKAIRLGSDTWRDEQAEIAIKLNEAANAKLKAEAEARDKKLVEQADRIREEKRQEAANALGVAVSSITDAMLQQYLTDKKRKKMSGALGMEPVTATTTAAASTVIASLMPVVKKVLNELGDDDTSLLEKGLTAGLDALKKTEILDKGKVWFEDKILKEEKDDDTEITEEEREKMEDDLENNNETYYVQVSASDTQKKRDKLSGKLNPDSPNYDPEVAKQYASESKRNLGGIAIVAGLATLLFLGSRK